MRQKNICNLGLCGLCFKVFRPELMVATYFAQAEKTIEDLKGKVLDWQNASSWNRDEADNLKATAEDWKHRADGERKKQQDVEAKVAEATQTTSRLATEVEIFKKVELELKDRMGRMGKEKEATKSALANAKEQYLEVPAALVPLVDALAPNSLLISHESLLTSLLESAKGLKEYILDLAGTCATHVLYLVKALYQDKT